MNKGLKPDLHSGLDKSTCARRKDEEIVVVVESAGDLDSDDLTTAEKNYARLAANKDRTRSADMESAMSDSDVSIPARPDSPDLDSPSKRDIRKRPRHGKHVELSSSSSSGEENRPAPKIRSGKAGRGRSSPMPARDKHGRFLAKRTDPARTETADEARSVSGSEEVIHCTPKEASRGRGRPPTTGAYVGLARAKAELVAAEREAMELQAEKEVAEAEVAEAARKSYMLRPSCLSETSEEGPTVADYKELVLQKVSLISQVAAKSSNLKGTFVRTLKDAATSIADAVEALSSASVSAETRKLSAQNDRLKAEVADLRGELAALRADLLRSQEQRVGKGAPSPASAPVDQEHMQRTIIEAVGKMVSARFEALEDRLLPEKRLRPPLASDRTYSEVSRSQAASPLTSMAPMETAPRAVQKAKTRTVTQPDAAISDAAAIPGPSPSTIPQDGKKGKNRGKRKKRVTNVDPAQERSRTQPSAASGEWTAVVRRKAKRGKGPKPAAKRKPNLRPPTTSAVVLKLQPDAEKRGITYARILMQAKKAVDLGSLGIQSLGFKRAMTGARILVLPGATSSGKADLLASKLKEALKEEDVRVSRPEKSATLRISGLDDSVGPFEVMAEISRIGECPPASIKVGEVRRDRSGLGTLLVSCPVGAAKTVMGVDRLFIGWSTVHRKLLDMRPLRCFKCLQLGHVREQCTAEVEHGGACYRCGQSGHKSGECTAAPHCLVCAAAKKPSGHKVGGRACACAKPARKPARKKGGKAATVPTAQSQPIHSATSPQETPMATG